MIWKSCCNWVMKYFDSLTRKIWAVFGSGRVLQWCVESYKFNSAAFLYLSIMPLKLQCQAHDTCIHDDISYLGAFSGQTNRVCSLCSWQDRLIHILTGDAKGAVMFSFQSPHLLPFSCIIYTISAVISFVFFAGPLCLLNTYHHPHNHHIITISGFATSVSVHYDSSCPSRFIQSVSFKFNCNYYTWTPSCTKLQNQWQYWILAAIFCCCSWSTALNWYGYNFSCFVTWWAPVTDKHFPCHKILFPVNIFLSYSVLPCQDTLLNASWTAANDFDPCNVQE
jgi:hypothetical protein